jgi:phage tail sheath protein FI
MPEYLAPAVYVEETSFRSKSIAGVGTSTAAFVGATARGPRSDGADGITPPLLTSVADYERYYGGLDELRVGTDARPNYMALAVQAFFANGGGRLYVARVCGAGASAPASAGLVDGAAAAAQVTLRGRYPGGGRIPGRSDEANLVAVLRQEERESTKANALRQPAGTMVRIDNDYYVVGTTPLQTSAASADAFNNLPDTGTVRLVALGIEVSDASGVIFGASSLAFHTAHPRYAGLRLGAAPPSTADRLTNPVVLDRGANVTAVQLRAALLGALVERPVALTGGREGTALPTAVAFGQALDRLLALEDISIVAAPGSSSFPDAAAVTQLLIGHAQTRRAYRIAVLDTPPSQEIADVRALKGGLDSSHAALYYPWIEISNPAAATDPTAPARIAVPPSGAVCGIYARNDIQRGVWKSPANEVVTGALDLQRHVRFGEQEVLNPLGVNCIRALPNRGIRVWGARTTSSDPEWMYVAVRRYFLYLEASIDRGTQWAVFEPNGERLWDNVRTTVEDFLYNEWISGALLGATPQEAYFVRCDRTTMTQNDLDNGRLVCLIGVAALKPAEFVIFRIGQKTTDARN